MADAADGCRLQAQEACTEKAGIQEDRYIGGDRSADGSEAGWGLTGGGQEGGKGHHPATNHTCEGGAVSTVSGVEVATRSGAGCSMVERGSSGVSESVQAHTEPGDSAGNCPTAPPFEQVQQEHSSDHGHSHDSPMQPYGIGRSESAGTLQAAEDRLHSVMSSSQGMREGVTPLELLVASRPGIVRSRL